MSPIDKISSAPIGDIPSVDQSSAAAAVSVPVAPANVAPPPEQNAAQEQQLDTSKIIRQVAKINSAIEPQNLRLSFGVEGRVFFLKVIDMSSGNVVKQVPPKEIMDYLNSIETDVNSLTGAVDPLVYMRKMVI